ncbi:MAG: sigma-54 dependent transcriptional regulator [Pseudomonadota bacterium]
MSKRVLVVDDDPVQCRLLQAAITKLGYDVTTLNSGDMALELLENRQRPQPHVIVLDLIMPGMDGLAVMARMAEKDIEIPVIVQTAKGGVDVAVSAMRAGAFDFCVKPTPVEKLNRAIIDALKVSASKTSEPKPAKTSSRAATTTFIGQCEPMKRVQRLITKAAASDIPVLIEGESGTGKELVARSLQSQSARANKPFVIVNCGAIPENLVESILFGHERGAFTGATEKHTGKFIEADGGTLFLDEIGDLPLEAQVKVLRAIQDGEVEPVGARSSKKVNVRLISATHRDLIAAVREGRFREDLYYRLNVFPILVPPLRYRKEDIAELTDYFITQAKIQGPSDVTGISREAMDLLVRHDWPGNIRQLQNAVSRAVVLSDSDTLGVDLFPQIAAQVDGIALDKTPPSAPEYAGDDAAYQLPPNHSTPIAAAPEVDYSDYLKLVDEDGHIRSLTDLESDTIEAALDRYNGRMSEVARRLGIGRSTLYRKLKEYALDEEVV